MFTMSIEVLEGFVYHDEVHLGAREAQARMICVEYFKDRVAFGMPTVTIGLKLNGKLVDTFYGDKWHSEMEETHV